MDRIICIVGPTASGKTCLSVALARALGGEVISFDSMQVYRRMDIGTAKPTREEMEGVPHHMIDVVDPEEDFSVGRYVREADRCLQDILGRNRPAVLVGGTGLYVDSLIAGREFAPGPPAGCREELTRIAAEQGIGVLTERLRALDPEAAAAIHPANEKRIIRALEICLETGETYTEHNRRTAQLPPKYKPLWLGLDYHNRADLYDRIDRRVPAMFDRGLEEEVRALLDSGVSPEATSMQAIGYKEMTAYLQGRETKQEAMEAIQQGSRRYAKRQRTWFRRNPAVHWLMLDRDPDFHEVFQEARQLIPFFAEEA